MYKSFWKKLRAHSHCSKMFGKEVVVVASVSLLFLVLIHQGTIVLKFIHKYAFIIGTLTFVHFWAKKFEGNIIDILFWVYLYFWILYMALMRRFVCLWHRRCRRKQSSCGRQIQVSLPGETFHKLYRSSSFSYSSKDDERWIKIIFWRDAQVYADFEEKNFLTGLALSKKYVLGLDNWL